MNDRPSGATATPSSSVGPKVICSGFPLGNRCRHKCQLPKGWVGSVFAPPSAEALKYIHFPSGDQPAAVQKPGGPTRLPSDVPSKGKSRQGCQVAVRSISTISADLRSGDAE